LRGRRFAAGEHDSIARSAIAVAHRKYARALFEAAKERGRLEQVRDELGDFVSTINDVPELRSLLRNPQLDPRARRAALDELLGDSDELVRNFLLLTAEKGRSGQIEEIHREFERLVAAEERRLRVELTTAYELSEDEARGLVKQIEDASGQRVEATRRVDPDLIGGLVLQAGSLRVDASVRGRLERLRQELATARR
jgi:F-type H+-transporting ATPase subunit delta